MRLRPDLVQGSEPWYQWRMGGIGASDAVSVGIHWGLVDQIAWIRNLDDLYLEKTGQVQKETFESWRLRRGHAAEGFVRASLEDLLHETFLPMCVEAGGEYPELRASLDGLNFSGDHVAEIKVAGEKVHAAALEGEVVSYYKAQLAYQGICLRGHPEQWRRGSLASTFASGAPEMKDRKRRTVAITKDIYEYRDLALKLYPKIVDFVHSIRERRHPMGEAFVAAASRLNRLAEVEANVIQARCDAFIKAQKLDVARERIAKERERIRSVLQAEVESLGIRSGKALGVSVTHVSNVSNGYDYEGFIKSLGLSGDSAASISHFAKTKDPYWLIKAKKPSRGLEES